MAGRRTCSRRCRPTFPDAERFCLWNDSDGRFTAVHETILARTPLRRNKALALPFMPIVWRHQSTREADFADCDKIYQYEDCAQQSVPAGL